jgi:hypothetical protein
MLRLGIRVRDKVTKPMAPEEGVGGCLHIVHSERSQEGMCRTMLRTITRGRVIACHADWVALLGDISSFVRTVDK